jgi:transcriptional regulator with XRE-family HTH domain
MTGLKRLRERQFLTQMQLAGRLGIDRYQTISAWERGTARPRPAMMKRLCEALLVTPDELLAALDERVER